VTTIPTRFIIDIQFYGQKKATNEKQTHSVTFPSECGKATSDVVLKKEAN